MLKVFSEIWSILTPKERRKLPIIMSMMLCCAFLELLGLGLAMPVIAMLANPDLIRQNYYLKLIHTTLNPSSDRQFILMLCALVALFYIGKNIFLSLMTWMQGKFVYEKTASIADSLFKSNIRAPYSYHLQKNSSDILNSINLVGAVGSGMLTPAICLATELFVVLAIMAMLLFLTPLTTLALAVAAALVSFSIYRPFKNMNLELGRKINRHSGEVFRVIAQAFEGIKECKVRNCEDFFAAHHAKCQSNFRRVEMLSYFTGQLPRFSIEALVVSAAMCVLAVFILSGVATGSIVLKLSIIAVSMVRLMPSISRMQYYTSTIRQRTPAFEMIVNDIKGIKQERVRPSAPPIEFTRSIVFDNISFSYNQNALVVSSFNLEIPRNSSVALVGSTGCGKTTIMDLMLGLLKPSSGKILVDGRCIEENLTSWQTKIGYVPQFIHLADDTIKSNVAFGTPAELIDEPQVRRCLETAQLWSFIQSLPDGLDTVIGERGVRLSGGQRQRIGIARALYHNPQILALDEATSALDNDTEKAFVDALKALQGKLTIVIIAHRLTTVENCDKIIMVDTKTKDMPSTLFQKSK